MLKKQITPFAVLTLTLAVAACGGGGGGGGSSVKVGSTDSGSQVPAVPAAELAKAMSYRIQAPGMLENYVLNIGGKLYKPGDSISLVDAKEGFTEHDYTSSGVFDPQGRNIKHEYTGTVQVYKQAYSFIYGDLVKTASFNGKESEPVNEFRVNDFGGLVTENKNLPQTGNFTYQGVAMADAQPESRGLFTYNVNFDRKVGSGRIDGIAATGAIQLQEAGIMQDKTDYGLAYTGIVGKAQSAALGAANYEAVFFGPKAEEIAGTVTLGGSDTPFGTTEVNFIGKR